MKELGKCYEMSGKVFMDHSMGFGSPLRDVLSQGFQVVLVHGLPTLQVEPFIKYGHAWLEIGESLVYDAERDLVILKHLFYEGGEIDPEECFRYDFETFRKRLNRFKHWGPWDGPEGCGPV